MSFLHARTFETRYGLVLAFIDLDETADDVEVLKLQLWLPIGEDKSDGRVCLKIGLPSSASAKAHDLMSEANRSALVGMDAARVEAVLDQAGLAEMMDTSQVHP